MHWKCKENWKEDLHEGLLMMQDPDGLFGPICMGKDAHGDGSKQSIWMGIFHHQETLHQKPIKWSDAKPDALHNADAKFDASHSCDAKPNASGLIGLGSLGWVGGSAGGTAAGVSRTETAITSIHVFVEAPHAPSGRQIMCIPNRNVGVGDIISVFVNIL